MLKLIVPIALVLLAGAQPRLVPYVPTPEDVVDRMLRLALVTPKDIVYDLGSGDGRIPILAARKYGARGVGIDIDPRRIEESRANAKAAGVEHLVEFRLGDVLQADVSAATVVTLYMLKSVNEKLRPILKQQLRPGARIVSHAFSMGPEWPADRVEQFTSERGDEVTLYLWTVQLPNSPRPTPKRARTGNISDPITENSLGVGTWEVRSCQAPYRASARSTISSISCV
jgi:predicted RNA methylase